MAHYFISDSRGNHGPYPPEQLPGQGVTAQTMVWCEGMADWQPAGSIAELARFLAAPAASAYAPQAAYGGYPAQGGYAQDGYVQDGYAQAPQAQYYPPATSYGSYAPRYQAPSSDGSGLGMAALIVGIASFFVCVASPVAIILGFMAVGKPAGKGTGMGGLICGFASLVLHILVLLIFFALVSQKS